MKGNQELRRERPDEDAVSAQRREIFGSLGMLALGGGSLALLGCGRASPEEAGDPDRSDVLERALSGQTSVRWCDTMAEQQALKGGTSTSSLNVCIRRGYASPADGGGGGFVWTTDTTTPQSSDPAAGLLVVPTGTRTGCWKRLYDGPINAKWFGAKGDGSTNDGPAIQNAITAAKALLPTGATLYFPSSPSPYVVNTAVTVNGRVSFLGQTKEGVKFVYTGATNPFVMFAFVNVSHFFVKNVTLCNGSTVNTQNGVLATLLKLTDCVYFDLDGITTASNAITDNRIRGIWIENTANPMPVAPPRGLGRIANYNHTNLGGQPGYTATDAIGIYAKGSPGAPIDGLKLEGYGNVEENNVNVHLENAYHVVLLGAWAIGGGTPFPNPGMPPTVDKLGANIKLVNCQYCTIVRPYLKTVAASNASHILIAGTASNPPQPACFDLMFIHPSFALPNAAAQNLVDQGSVRTVVYGTGDPNAPSILPEYWRFGAGQRMKSLLSGQACWLPNSGAAIPAGGFATITVPVPGATLDFSTDTVLVGFSNALSAGILLTGAVNTDSVVVTMFNGSGAAFTMGWGVVRADVFRHDSTFSGACP